MDTTELKLKKFYLEQKKSIQQIADMYGVSYTLIHKKLVKFNIPRRTLQEAQINRVKSTWNIIGLLKHNKSIMSGKTLNCIICGTTFYRARDQLQRNNNNFCSHKCYSEWLKENPISYWAGKERLEMQGENNVRWTGGMKYGKISKWRRITRKVRKRDNYTCQNCGLHETNKAFDVHHKNPYQISRDNSFTNLVTLCATCHMKEEWTLIKESGRVRNKF